MCELTEGDFEGFFEAPFSCYGDDTRYVSPMKPDLKRLLGHADNPFFDGHGSGTFFVLRRGGRPVGRISAHVHHDSNDRYGTRKGFFGLFDCIDDREVAKALLGAAEGWVRSHGCTQIAGNFVLTAVQEIGVVTGGFDRAPYTAMHFNPPHIPRLLQACGYAPTFPMSTFELDLDAFDPECLVGTKHRELDESPELEWVGLDRRRFKQAAGEVREILNVSFAENPMFVPLSSEEFSFQAAGLMWVVDGRLSQLARMGGKPMGVLACIPDMNPLIRSTRSRVQLSTPVHYLRHRFGRRRAVIVFGGVHPAAQNRGLGAILLRRVTTALKSAGYTSLGITWVSRQNGPSMRFMEKLGAEPLHELAIFEKALS